MRRNAAKQFWTKYIKLACAKGTDITVLNPVHTFIQHAHMGIFDKISDKDFAKKQDDIKDLSSFWDCRDTKTAKNVLLNAMAKTDITDTDISNIAGILASASVRTHYHTKELDKDKATEGISNPDSKSDSDNK